MTAIVLSTGQCDFCGNEESILGCDLLYRLEDITAHYFCLLFSSGLGQRGEEGEGIKGFLASDIRSELRRGARLKCVHCKKKGATVGCAEVSCKKSYHLNCGAGADCLLQYFGQFKSLCSRHRGAGYRPRRSAGGQPSHCTICLSELPVSVRGRGDPGSVFTRCCDGGFHRACVQALAVSAGRHHFRCPNCQDTESWASSMLEAGIYIPEQDASWERPGEVTEVARVCHAKLCFCSHEEGRSHHSEHGLWEILKCDSCGYKGIHAKCGGMENVSDPTWHCYTCRSALRQRGQGDIIRSQVDKLWDRQMTATISLVPGLAERLQSQGIKQRPGLRRSGGQEPGVTKISYTTSLTDLLGSMLDKPDSPGDSDYESQTGDRGNMLRVEL